MIKDFSVATTFVFYCDVKRSGILRGSSRIRCYLFFRGFSRNCDRRYIVSSPDFTPSLSEFQQCKSIQFSPKTSEKQRQVNDT